MGGEFGESLNYFPHFRLKDLGEKLGALTPHGFTLRPYQVVDLLTAPEIGDSLDIRDSLVQSIFVGRSRRRVNTEVPSEAVKVINDARTFINKYLLSINFYIQNRLQNIGFFLEEKIAGKIFDGAVANIEHTFDVLTQPRRRGYLYEYYDDEDGKPTDEPTNYKEYYSLALRQSAAVVRLGLFGMQVTKALARVDQRLLKIGLDFLCEPLARFEKKKESDEEAVKRFIKDQHLLQELNLSTRSAEYRRILNGYTEVLARFTKLRREVFQSKLEPDAFIDHLRIKEV